MVDIINISEKEYKDMTDFYNEKIDHVFINPYDEPNPTMICHGGNGKVMFNGQQKTLNEIKEDVKKELNNNSKHFHLDVACCYANQLSPEINNDGIIIPRYKNDGILYCRYTKNKLFLSDYPIS